MVSLAPSILLHTQGVEGELMKDFALSRISNDCDISLDYITSLKTNDIIQYEEIANYDVSKVFSS